MLGRMNIMNQHFNPVAYVADLRGCYRCDPKEINFTFFFQVSASVSVPNLSSSQEASQMMESFVRSMTRAPAVLNVNEMTNSEEKNLNAQLDSPDTVGKKVH